MNKKPTYHRLIASFLLTIFIPSLLPLNLLHATNNGPTSPEASSFEPTDAKDMVNLLTGDMAYVLPLLNVPSPEGGYPLSLSNHAGIANDQEASWVGLGWSLNPGAINRGVTGVPDDWKETRINQIVYDAGGNYTSYSASVAVGWNNVCSTGLYGSYSENKTFGGTTTYATNGGVMASLGLSDSFGISANIGTDGIGAGFSYGNSGSDNKIGVGVNQSFEDGSTSIGAGLSSKINKNASTSSIGISFDSSNGLSGSIVGQGFKISANNFSLARLNISTQSYNISAQIYNVNIGLGFSKARYWTFQQTYTTYNGSLYAGDMYNFYQNHKFPSKIGFDSYSSIYRLDSDKQLEEDNLSYIGYDSYSVSGQGISGTMKPGIFQPGSLVNPYKSRSSNGNTVSYKMDNYNLFTRSMSNTGVSRIPFYFENEASSYFRSSSGEWAPVSSNASPTSISTPVTLHTGQFINKTENDVTNLPVSTYIESYSPTTLRKRTGNYVEVFTNSQILNSPGSIINPENYDRSQAPAEGIGAFRITTLDGKVYHYSIPVYQKYQFMKATNHGIDFAYRFYEREQLKEYATHWLLTAITGPDYVDVNNNHKVDQGDYGYWTEFDYGKWSDGFPWKTVQKSSEKSKMYEWGVKEIYYLDKIKTRTHTAIFVKEIRDDAIGRANAYSQTLKTRLRSFIQDKNNPGDWYLDTTYNTRYWGGASNVANSLGEVKYHQTVNIKQHKSLKLKKILLLKNEDANISKNSARPNTAFNGYINFNEEVIKHIVAMGAYDLPTLSVINKTWEGEYYNNVFDVSDFNTTIEQKAIKTISFNYSTRLAKNSPNSDSADHGRLTLESVDFLGRQNAKIIPPYKFDYINTENYDGAKEDNWGYNQKEDEWSLNSIITPTGSKIGIVYESDDVDKEAVEGARGFETDVEFIFTTAPGQLRIKMRNELGRNNINFEEFYQPGPASLDLWASVKKRWLSLGGCNTRSGCIDIPPTMPVTVTSVSPTEVNFTTNISCAQGSYADRLLNTPVSYNNHPNFMLKQGSRGAFPSQCCSCSTLRLILVYKISGNKVEASQDNKKGGGLRVKEVSVSEGNVKKNILKYYYNVPGYGENTTDTNYKSSGITSYIPHKYFKDIKYISELPSPMVMYEYVTVKSFSENGALGASEEYNFEVLKPDTSSNQDNLNLGNILKITKTQTANIPNCSSNSESYNLNLSRYEIKDMTADVGRLNQKKVFNNLGQLMSKEVYFYKPISDIQQGINEESFHTYKKVSRTDSSISYGLSVTSKTKYPSMLERIETSQGGYTAKVFYDKYDFLTGQLTDARFMSSNGTIIKTRNVAAYKRYPEMGLKADNVANQNMLTQNCVEYKYIYDPLDICMWCTPSPPDGNNYSWKEISANITTWQKNIWGYKRNMNEITFDSGNTYSTNGTMAYNNIWRKHKTYTWNGERDFNGLFINYDRIGSSTTSEMDDEDGFVWITNDSYDGDESQPTNISSTWKLLSETTLYNHYSHPLEVKDINGNYLSTKMGNNESEITTSGNARYSELFFTGCENTVVSGVIDPGIKLEGAYKNNSIFHTGRFCVNTDNSTQKLSVLMSGPQYNKTQHRAGKYKLSVWVYKNNNYQNARISVNGNVSSFNGETYYAGNWVLKTHYFEATVNDTNIYLTTASGTISYDDLMIKPVGSSMVGYIYDELGRISSIIGNNGLATLYEYNNSGHLTKTFYELIEQNGITNGGFKLKSENKIKYKN